MYDYFNNLINRKVNQIGGAASLVILSSRKFSDLFSCPLPITFNLNFPTVATLACIFTQAPNLVCKFSANLTILINYHNY